MHRVPVTSRATVEPVNATAANPGEPLIASRTRPFAVAPEFQIWFVTGFLVLLGTVSAMQPFVSGEGREWMVYVVGTLMAPFVALTAPVLAGRLPGRLLLALIGGFVVCGAVCRADQRIFSAAGHVMASAAFALPLALATSIPVWWLGSQLVRHTSTGTDENPNGVEVPTQRLFACQPGNADSYKITLSFRTQQLFACLCIVACGLMLRQTSFWFDRRIIICLSLISVFSWLTWRAWYRATSPTRTRMNAWIDVAWYVAFALGTLIPLYPPGDGFLHHWSYYQGPISLVQSGGLPLWDVPSQYGFLAILAPALLPFREAASGMHAIMSAMMFAEAFLLYRLIRDFRTGVFFRVWAGLAVLVAVYHFSGDRGGLGGPFEYPSTGAYRTFWVFMLAYVLTDLPLAGRPSRSLTAQCVWTSVLLVAGCLWSSESAIYCLGVLGVTGIAEGAVLTFRGLWRQEGRSWLLRYVIPIVALAQAVLGISALYLFQFGFLPDWFTFVEFALTYAGKLGVLPVEPDGAVLLMALSLGVAACYAVSRMVQAKEASAARLIAPYGAMIGTLSYYVARSHESNICNLVGLWFPLLLLLYASSRERRDPAWTTALQCLILPAFVVMTSMVLCLEPRGLNRLKAAVTGLPARSVEAAIDGRFAHFFSLLPVIRGKIGDLPLTNVSAYYPPTNVPALPNRPFLPIAPREEFFLLPPDRQKLYLERSLKRQTDVPVGILFRRDPPAPFDVPAWRGMHDEVIRNINEILPRYYVLEETQPLDEGYRLERWRRR